MSQTALSLKQPWATMLVHGIKSIEVRVWPTPRRGPILIHAARIPDPRPEAWAHIPDHLRDMTSLTGGIIGSAVLLDCRKYSTLDQFAADQVLHRNELEWFQSPLYGFIFAEPKPLPFRKFPGWMRFFPVPDADLG